MTHEIVISGFGGQGVMAMGKTLAEAGMKEGLCVSWLPSYGPEMRGGTANCSVVLSGEEIISPMVQSPTELIAMNKPSLVKFEPQMVPGGKLFVNSSIIELKASRADISAYYIPCLSIAEELGNIKVANMVMLGAYIGATGLLQTETIRGMLAHMFTGPKAALVELNIEALRRGAACVREA
ncbi:MAG: Pyruvate synthase subunit PorC [Firmicutes bacterium ADurb.Bin248]|nr:MAG: Pyruvate synthase subunit PorC [Firmicutes bacterium ADurb.Bin248]HOG00389.1 2-oxoacid:acceptor oxidoreductase family protein [Clostridia bacterium]HPK15217.1 2-oxoacid:acceptor oxidoreductase family protein [Clostridia bacterium]